MDPTALLYVRCWTITRDMKTAAMMSLKRGKLGLRVAGRHCVVRELTPSKAPPHTFTNPCRTADPCHTAGLHPYIHRGACVCIVRMHSQCTEVQLHSLLGRQQAVHEERGHEVDHVVATEHRLSARGEEAEK